MNNIIEIDILSRAHHLNQIITGFLLYAKTAGYKVKINTHFNDNKYKFTKTACVVYINNTVLVYDMSDGYQSIEASKYLYGLSDFYFKRSFSKIENDKIGLNNALPLGFNYDVMLLSKAGLYQSDSVLKTLYKIAKGKIITPKMIETVPKFKQDGHKVLFSARLWQRESSLSNAENDERDFINETRVNIIRSLKRELGDRFLGGLEDNAAARKYANDLIISKRFTNRKNYLKIMKSSDICIATTGLHNSIGWKMGEYVAASKAIIAEKLHYEVTGEFEKNKNYLEFSNADDCIKQVYNLLSDPQKIYDMQIANRNYYLEYLEPKKLIINSLIKAGVIK